MKPTHESRAPEDAAAEKTAGSGGNGAKGPAGGGTVRSGTPHSWRQYIEQSMPTGAETEQETAGIRQPAPAGKVRTRTEWERFTRRTARWARENRRQARLAAAEAREILDDVAANVRETLGRGAETVRGLVARHPISPMLYATVLAVGIGAMVFQSSYARAYVLEVNGQAVGLVADEDEANAILGNVENRAASVLGDDFDYDVDVTLSPVYVAPDALTDAAEMEDALFEDVGAYMTAWAISVDGEELGYAADSDQFYRMLDEIAQPYVPAGAVHYEFVEDVQIYCVELPSNTEFDVGSIRAELSALRAEESVYVVQAGDTFNAIAASLGMTPDELSALNPDVDANQLYADQELVTRQSMPRLSVVAVTDETYEEVIPHSTEYIETADLYVGTTKVKEQGEDGLDRVNAQVTYLNNVEQDRDILERTTLKEAATTYIYTGTTPKPVTASKGYLTWPVQGRISSGYGSRYIFGSVSNHGGIDIACAYGATIKAADGGEVTFAGYQGTFGNLVIITHDDGKQTYYAHNSSFLVSVGQRVYQGQGIALAGATGNATGPHCHFEVRINGSRVNPLNYLS